MRNLKKLCDKVMRRRTTGKNKGVYWWTPEIAKARKIATRARREVPRARKTRTEGQTMEGKEESIKKPHKHEQTNGKSSFRKSKLTSGESLTKWW